MLSSQLTARIELPDKIATDDAIYRRWIWLANLPALHLFANAARITHGMFHLWKRCSRRAGP